MNTQLPGARLQEVQQSFAADAAEAVTPADEPLPREMNRDIVPMVKAGEDGRVRFGVGGAEIPHGLVRKDHAPAERVIRPVPLVYFHAHRWQRLAKQYGGIQTGGTTAQTHDSPHRNTDPLVATVSSQLHVCYIAKYFRCQLIFL